MSEYVTNSTWASLAQRLRDAKSVVLVTHQRPDGDAMGSVLALKRAMETHGRTASIALMGPVEPALAIIAGTTAFSLVEHDGLPDDTADLVVLVDTGAWTQLEPMEAWLRTRPQHVIGIDHHPRGDLVAGERIVDPSAASATVLVGRLLDEMGWGFGHGDESVAEALFLGLATDTGWFRHANADTQAFAFAARLLECGVDKTRLYQLIEEGHPPERLALEARALSSLEFLLDGQVAIQTLRPADFAASGATLENLTGMVNLPMVVGRVRVAVLLAEGEPGVTKLSFRAKPGGGRFTNVNELAQHFGGGGHVFAAGARIAAPLEEARRRLLAVLNEPEAA